MFVRCEKVSWRFFKVSVLYAPSPDTSVTVLIAQKINSQCTRVQGFFFFLEMGEKMWKTSKKQQNLLFLGGNFPPKGPEKTLLVYIVESDICSVDTSQGKRGAKLVVKIESKPPTRGLKCFCIGRSYFRCYSDVFPRGMRAPEHISLVISVPRTIITRAWSFPFWKEIQKKCNWGDQNMVKLT